MSSMMELMSQLGGGNLGTVSKAVGADEKATQGALAAALRVRRNWIRPRWAGC